MLKSELGNRVVFGGLAALVALLAIYQGGIVFYLFVAALSLIISLEFDKLRGDGKVSFLFCAVPILFAFQPLIAIISLVVAIVAISFYRHYPWLVISIPYITAPAVALIWLRGQEDGFGVVLWLVLAIIATDTGAYFAGKSFGKNLLAPKISPKKTWEGLAGGVLAAAVVSWFYTGNGLFALAGMVFAVLGQVSDLMESGIKRHFGVKDTGNILPGHGGAMDRLDSLVLTAPAAAIATYYGLLPW